jgi:WD40 repeat protein
MLDRDDPSAEPIHRLRLACVLGRHPRLEGIVLHTSRVLDARFDASGGRMLTRTEDGRAWLWDPYRSRPVAAPLPHDGEVLGIAVSPDGTRAATAGADGTARLWDPATGRPLGPPMRHPGIVRHAAFRPDGRRLATACDDGDVRFWAVPGGDPIEPAVRLGGEARFAGFSPDGRLVVTVDGRDEARVWDAADRRPLGPPLPHRLATGTPTDRLSQPPLFSPDGARLLTVDPPSDDETTVRVSDARTGAPAMPPRTVDFVLNRAAFSPDGGRILLVGKNSRSHLIDAATGRTILALDHPREVQAGCFGADGRRVATSSSMGLIHIRDAQTGQDAAPPFGYAENLIELAFTPEGDRLVSVSLDGTVRIWSIDPDPIRALPYDESCGRADRLFAARRPPLSPDGAWEAVPDGAAGARLRRRRGGEPGLSLAHPGPVRMALFAPDGRSVLTADDLRVRVWDAGTGRPRGPFLPIEGGLVWVQCSDDGGRLMLIDAGGAVIVREVAGGRIVLGPIALDAELWSQRNHMVRHLVTLSPDGRRLAVHFPGRTPEETRVYEVDTGRSLAMADVSSGFVSSLAFSPDGRRLVSAASDTLARVWDAETGRPIPPAMRHSTFVRCAAFAPDGRLVATLEDDHVRFWDSATGDLLAPPLPHPLGGLADVWFGRDGGRVVALAPDGDARQWELPTFRTATDRVIALVQLLTGRQVDASDGIAPLERSAFRDAPEDYRRAWLSWRGQGDDPPARPGGR